ncbi:PhzF family phenazine biosynthesis protein [Frankia sp. CiP1_Cm_nod1]|uniref:PhzF family phenazine biosynthesis protein n=1 Tax=Frankia sp. CiP1_Cm_nod1 TaxID=2897160 RepID=UPI002025390E
MGSRGETPAVVTVRVVRVFTDQAGNHGNPLGVVEDAATIVPDPAHRQEIAARLGYSETVFIDDTATSTISIYTPRTKIPFAGHPAVGAAWFLGRIHGTPQDVLRTEGGDARTWTDDNGVWVRAALASTPPWWHERLDDPKQVDDLTGPLHPGQDFTQLWAWEDEDAGTIRVRTFADRVGIPEDEACGSGAMRLAAALGRPLTLHHGKGSVIHARPGPPGHADVGGTVIEDEPRTL